MIFNVPISKSVSALMSDNSIQMCSDAALILLAMVRSLLNPVSTFVYYSCDLHVEHSKEVQWLSGRVLDLRLRGRRFKPHLRHCVVVLEQDTFFLA